MLYTSPCLPWVIPFSNEYSSFTVEFTVEVVTVEVVLAGY